MKPTRIHHLLAAFLCILTACSSDNLLEQENHSTVSFRISIPREMGTRSDEATPQYTLAWTLFAINESEGKETKKYVDSGSRILNDIEEEPVINLNLAKGGLYKIVFCAYNAESKFASYNEREAIISVNYENAAVIQTNDDMYVGSYEPIRVEDGEINQTITLKRPFAQLNWATRDLDAPTVTPYLKGSKAYVEVIGELFTSLDLFDNSLTNPFNSYQFREFDCSNLQSEFLSIGEDGSKYMLLASNLLLTGTEPSTLKCEMKFSGNVNVTASVENASVAPDYKTNIYGRLITEPADITVNLAPYSAINPIIIHTAADFVKRILAGENVEVPEGETIDLGGCNEITLSDGQTLTVNGTLLLENEQIKVRDGNEATITGTGLIKSRSTSDGNLIEVNNESTLNLQNISIECLSTQKSTAAIINNNSTVKMSNTKISCYMSCIRALDNGRVLLTNCNLISEGYIKNGISYNGSYAVYTSNSIIEIDCCQISANYGDICLMSNSECKILNSYITIKTFKSNEGTLINECVNVNEDSKLIIESGKFKWRSPSNFIELGSGQVIISGGQFSSRINVSENIIIDSAYTQSYIKDTTDNAYWYTIIPKS